MRKREWRLTNTLKEDHGKPIYGIAFNFCDLRHKDVFATVGANRASVYELQPGGAIDVLQIYVDEERDESYFTCAWSVDDIGTPLLLVAGSAGVLRVLDCAAQRLRKTLTGHGNAINEIKVHPKQPSLVISASKDESLRLWNIATGVCVLILAGDGGHRNEVLSVDFHREDPNRILTCGMDNTIKIWHVHGVQATLEASHTWVGPGTASEFPTRHIQHPAFCTFQVHDCYVDCVRWHGDLVLSKSTENKIALWQPDEEPPRSKGSALILHEYSLTDCELWFIKFGQDFHGRLLALGNRRGRVHVWDALVSPPVQLARTVPGPTAASAAENPVRQTAVSFDGRTILAACDDGSVVRWDDLQFEAAERQAQAAAAAAAQGEGGGKERPEPGPSGNKGS